MLDHLGQQVGILQRTMQFAAVRDSQALEQVVELVGHARPAGLRGCPATG